MEKRINSGGRIEPNQIYVLIGAIGVGGITRLSSLEEIGDRFWSEIMEHDAEGNVNAIERREFLRVPKVDNPGAGTYEETDPLVVPQSPRKSELSRTCGGVVRSRDFSILGRLGGRRGRLALGRVTTVGSACWFGSGAGRPGLATRLITLLLGDAVMVRKLSSQVIRLYGDRKGLGRSEREEKDNECG